MSVRARALLASTVVLVACLAAIPLAGAARSGSGSRVLLTRCVGSVLGGAGPTAARSARGSGAGIAASFSIFRRARTATDALPASAHLAASLGREVVSYDPSRLVRLRRTGPMSLYAVPATVAPVTLPAACSGLRALAGVGAFIAAQGDVRGSGPGACLIATQLVPQPGPGLPLPGTRPPARQLQITSLLCRSAAAMAGYDGALGNEPQPGFALIPDGINAITYTFPGGRQITAPVAGNLLQTPRAVIIPPSPHPLTPSELTAQLTSHLPTSITEAGPAGQTVVVLPRPDTLIPDDVGEFSFLKRLASELGSGRSGSSSTGEGSVSCRARTHRCLAVSVTTTCDARLRCHTTRAIHRYRYLGHRPPPGTIGASTLPTAPIVGRADRLVRRPGRLSLVLSGTVQAHTVVIEVVSCSLRGGQAEGGGPPLVRAVPSRSRIVLPGRAAQFSACDIGVLVTSHQRGPVRARVVRG